MVLADLGGLGDTAAGEQDLDDDTDGVPVDGGFGADAFGEPEARAGEVLGLGESAATVADVSEEGVAEGEMRAVPTLGLEVGDPGGEQFLGAARAVGVHEGEGDQDGHLEAAVGLGPADPSGEGAFGVVERDVGGLAAQGGVPGAQADDIALGEVAAGEPVGEAGQAAGAGRGVGFVGAEGVPHELFGLHAQPHPGVTGHADLTGQRLGGLGEPVAVGEDLGQPVDDVVAQLRIGDGALRGRPGGG